jgi:hypothetical protein
MDSFKSFVKEEKPGLYANIHAKRARIKAGSGEKMRKPGSEGAPTTQDWKDAAKTAKEEVEIDEAKDINFHRAELKKTNDKIEAITKQGGRVGLNDPLTAKLKYHAAQIKKLKEAYEVSEAGGYSPNKHPQSKDYGRGEDEEDERDDEDDDEPPFKPDAKKKMAVAGKKGYGPSAAKHLAKTGMKANEEVEPIDEAKGLAGMSLDQLKQEHDKVQNKIQAQGVSKMISMNHPLSQRARAIRLHMMIKKKQANEEVEIDEIYSFPEPTSLVGKAAMHTIGAVAVGALVLHQAFPSREKKPPLDHNIDKAYDNKDHKLYHSLQAHKHSLLAKHYNGQAEHVINSPSSYYKKDGQKGKKGEMKPSSKVNALYARQNAEHHERKAAHYAEKEKSGARIDESFDFEQIDELKKSTLASYAKKASHDARIKMATGKDFERISRTSKKPAYKAAASDWEQKYKSDARRREAGVNRAIDKLAKEEVELDEAAAEKTYNYAFDKVRGMDAKNPFSKSAKRTMYTKAARNAFQRMKSSGTKPNLPEEVEQIDEAVSVKKQSYSWGKMVTVHHGKDTSYPLHPEHQAKIKSLSDGESTSFNDETNRKVTAKRDGDIIHLSARDTNRTTPVARSHFTESTAAKLLNTLSNLDELKASTLNSYIAKRQGNTANRMAHAMRKLGGKPSKHDVYNTGLKRAQQKIDAKREKETGMNPRKPRPAAAPAYPLGGRDPASGRSYSEEVEVDEEQKYYSLVHKSTNKVLSTHKDLDSAKDEHRGMDQGVRALYRIVTSTKEPKTYNMKEEVEVDEMVRDIPLAKKVEQEYSDKMMKDFLARGGQIKQGKPQKAPKNTLRFIARGSLASGERTVTKTGSKSFTKRMGEEAEGVTEAKSSKYKIKAIGTDKRGDYYVHPTTGEKIYTAASKYPWEAPKRGDHVNPNTGKVTKESNDSVPASKALQKAHDDERKKRGLPDPSYYLKLAAQKKKEIEDLKNEK